jgi:uncharacterized lipoprotein
MNRLRIVAALLLVAVMLPGCGLFGRKSDYQQSRESRPLEIPPDLDTPVTSTALTIPVEGSGGSAARATTADSAGSAPPPPAPVVAGAASSLRVSDSVSGAWRRVGLALERSQVAEIVSRDETAATYTLTGTTTTRQAEGGVLKRMFTRDKVSTGIVTRIVRVVADGAQSSVRVEDESGAPVDDELARRVIEALRQRLG